jgi:hypothetical protein
VICIQVIDEDERAAAVLARDARVDRVERSNGQLLVSLHDPDTHHHFLVETLVAEKIRLHSIAPQQLKLEDVFLRLTKGMVQ